jgi:hypothetical protein
LTSKIAHRTLLAALLYFAFLVCSIHAQTITGKVVGVADGRAMTKEVSFGSI